MTNISKRLIIITLFSFVFCMGSVKASSRVDLGNGTIAPAKRFKIPLNKLVEAVNYKVTCKISNPSQSQLIMAVSSDADFPFPEKYINDKFILSQGSLESGQNTLLLTYANKSFINIVLSNTDQDMPIIIDSCIAEALTKR